MYLITIDNQIMVMVKVIVDAMLVSSFVIVNRKEKKYFSNIF